MQNKVQDKMQNKWFQLGSWSNREDSEIPVNGASKPMTNSDAMLKGTAAATNGAKQGFASPAGSDLMAFEEIYRSAGIKAPKLGYSIAKVIEMLHSEHIRNLSTEMKRASLLMALEAAGVPIDEVLQDASLRQRAINSYEAIQRKHLEEYEARKTQANYAIQAEMDRVAAEYAARISGNLDEVAREKDTFRKWQARKQHEAQRIAEAVALCATQGSQKTASDSLAPLLEMPAANDPAYSHRA